MEACIESPTAPPVEQFRRQYSHVIDAVAHERSSHVFGILRVNADGQYVVCKDLVLLDEKNIPPLSTSACRLVNMSVEALNISGPSRGLMSFHWIVWVDTALGKRAQPTVALCSLSPLCYEDSLWASNLVSYVIQRSTAYAQADTNGHQILHKANFGKLVDNDELASKVEQLIETQLCKRREHSLGDSITVSLAGNEAEILVNGAWGKADTQSSVTSTAFAQIVTARGVYDDDLQVWLTAKSQRSGTSKFHVYCKNLAIYIEAKRLFVAGKQCYAETSLIKDPNGRVTEELVAIREFAGQSDYALMQQFNAGRDSHQFELPL